MNSLANMFQGGMNNNYGSPDIPRKQFDVQPPVQNPQFGQNGQQNGYDKPQFGGGQPFKPVGFNNPQNTPINGMGWQNSNIWNHPKMDEWMQKYPRLAQFRDNNHWQAPNGNYQGRFQQNHPGYRQDWFDGNLGWPSNSGPNRGW